MNSGLFSRRTLLQTSAALASSSVLLSAPAAVAAPGPRPEQTLKGRLLKTLKIGMVRVEGSLTDKFKAVKAAGFDGIEMDAPGMNVEETKKAIAESGLPVDGTVNSTHWQVRHTDPDPAVRERALQSLLSAIEGTHAVGGHSVLLVIGHGKDGDEADIWKRSQANIAQAVPLAARLGVQIVIENVWNHFLYELLIVFFGA